MATLSIWCAYTLLCKLFCVNGIRQGETDALAKAIACADSDEDYPADRRGSHAVISLRRQKAKIQTPAEDSAQPTALTMSSCYKGIPMGWPVRASHSRASPPPLPLGAEDNFGMAAACFIPRHGIRLKGDGKTVDLVICFPTRSDSVGVLHKQPTPSPLFEA
jgi:hypothetical protein